MEFATERVVRNCEVNAIEVVDQHAEAEQEGDSPAIPPSNFDH